MPPHDLVLPIVLVDNNKNNELNPSIWRRFRVSSSVNLELLHDKVLCPVMGWTRNYHTYMFVSTHNHGGVLQYCQKDSNAADMCHVMYNASGRFQGSSNTAKPERILIGDLLKSPGDEIVYTYDLGDGWRHKITLEERRRFNNISDSELDMGAVRVLDGAMRCPDEDGEGCALYEKEILSLYRKSLKDPQNDRVARSLAQNCFERVNAMNVRGSFCPGEFDLAERQSSVDEAVASRNQTRKSVKMFGERVLEMAQVGQQFVTTTVEDLRGGDDNLFGLSYGETINLKPDPEDHTLCNCCGSPLHLKLCSACNCARYCSVKCQKKAWKSHEKVCKKEKAAVQKYERELASGKPNPNRMHGKGPIDYLTRYRRDQLRFPCRSTPRDK